MASPFHYFRKHQKPLIAAAAVLCMIIFVFSDALVGLIRSAASGSGAGRSAKSIVATWDGGSLNVRDLAILRSRRYFLSEFLRRLEITGAQRVIADGGTPTKPAIPEFILPENTSARAVEMSVVTARIFADLAIRMGIRVSDEVMNRYLREAGFRRVGGSEIVTMLKGFRVADRQATANVLFAALRDNLLAHTYQSGTTFASQTILPEQRWEDWRRVNDRIALEAAILPSQAMIAAVPEPSDAEVRAFYEEFKDREGGRLLNVMGAELPSPDPGFAQPRKVRLHYLVGDVFRWSEKLQETITDAEIEDYYQHNKRTQFVQKDTGLEESSAPAQSAPTKPAPTESGGDRATTESSTIELGRGEPDATNPSTGGESARKTPPETETPASKSSKPPKTEAGTDVPAGDETTEGDAETNKTGSLPSQSPFRLVALQAGAASGTGEAHQGVPKDEKTVVAASGDKTEGTPSDEKASGDEKAGSDEETSSEEKAGGEEDTGKDRRADGDEKAGAEKADAEIPKGLPVAQNAGGAGKPGMTSDAKDAEDTVKYQPLAEVRDQIRRQLATEKAVQQLKTTVDRLFTRMRATYNPYGEQRAIAKAQGSKMPAPPKQLASLTNLAKEYGLIYEHTPLLSRVQLARESLVGKAMDAQTGRASVTQRMLGKQDLYDPLLAKDIDGNWYVVIKVEDVPRHVPKFDEIRDQVLAAWKARQASKRALEKAEGWATEVLASNESFGDFFRAKQLADHSKVEIVTTDLFSWLTFGATPAEMQRGPRLGEAPPLVAVGPNFMTKAFEIKKGEVKVLQNYDRSQAYVARLHQRQRSEEELHKLFLTEANSWFGARFATTARWQQFQRQVFDQLTKRVGLEFKEGWDQEGL